MAEIRHRPITAIIVSMIGLYMIWFGCVFQARQAVPEIDPQSFSGPLMVCSLHTWGYVYIILGVVKIGRIFLFQYMWISRILHVVALVVLIEWAVALDTSAMSLLQPATTLVALLSLFNPWITNIIMRSGEVEYLVAMKSQDQHTRDDREADRRADKREAGQQA